MLMPKTTPVRSVMREKFNQLMAAMPASWRYSWCSKVNCDCLGAANCAGGVEKAGFNKQHWEYWVKQNPEPPLAIPVKSFSFTPPEPKVPVTSILSAEEFFAWQDGLSSAELQAYEEGRLAVGTRFPDEGGVALKDPVEIRTNTPPAPAMHEGKTIDEFMAEMPDGWRTRWCGGGICACMGAANCSGGLRAKGFTQADWHDWKKRNGIAEPVRSANVVQLMPKPLSASIANIVDGRKS